MLLPKREKAEQTLKRVLAVWKTEKPEKLDAFNAYGPDMLLYPGGVKFLDGLRMAVCFETSNSEACHGPLTDWPR
jgi:hypothetical protein